MVAIVTLTRGDRHETQYSTRCNDSGCNRLWWRRLGGCQPWAQWSTWCPKWGRHDAERWSGHDGEHGRNDGHDAAHARKHDGRRHGSGMMGAGMAGGMMQMF